MENSLFFVKKKKKKKGGATVTTMWFAGVRSARRTARTCPSWARSPEAVCTYPCASVPTPRARSTAPARPGRRSRRVSATICATRKPGPTGGATATGSTNRKKFPCPSRAHVPAGRTTWRGKSSKRRMWRGTAPSQKWAASAGAGKTPPIFSDFFPAISGAPRIISRSPPTLRTPQREAKGPQR